MLLLLVGDADGVVVVARADVADVLAKAKEMGIAGARVASSTLDKITAEYLIKDIIGDQQPSED